MLYVILAVGLFAKGLRESMAEFKVPPATLDSPHYYDAIMWVYTHVMVLVLGLVIGVVGWYAENSQLKKWLSRLLFVIHVYYAWLDFRSSDTVLGNGLYQGPGSVFPPLVCVFVAVLFLHLSFCRPSWSVQAKG